MILLKQSTASQEIPLGYFVDSTDGNTEETALTINNTDIKLWKNGATTLANKNSGGATHISNGIYYCVLDATDTNTLGPLVIFVHVSGALYVKLECLVVTAAAYDVMTAATGDAYARLGAPAGASVSADIAALPTATANADAVLKRDLSAVTGEAARSLLNALRFLRNKWSISGSTLTVTKEDDTTAAWTATLTTNAAADPVTGSDPA